MAKRPIEEFALTIDEFNFMSEEEASDMLNCICAGRMCDSCELKSAIRQTGYGYDCYCGSIIPWHGGESRSRALEVFRVMGILVEGAEEELTEPIWSDELF